MNKFKDFLYLNKVLTKKELNLKTTLLNGQCFFWKQETPNLFSGVFGKHHIFFRENEEGIIQYSEYPENKNLLNELYDFFQLEVDMQKLIEYWSNQDDYFKKIAERITGLRILKQDPFECLISFLCSQNNNIIRITQMLMSLKEKYGDFIVEREGKKHFSFPSLQTLEKVSEQDLRNMGFGYRADYIVESVKAIKEKGGVKWLNELRGKDHEEIREELMSLKGIGMKVADCIALFSLDCKECIPVDTHIWQLYQKVYNNNKKSMKINKENYDKIGDFFQKKFKKYSGWAHSLLFTAELNEFKQEVSEKKIKKKPNEEGFLETCEPKELISAKKTKKK